MQSVNELCEKGNSLSEVGMYQEALSCFKHALEKTPETYDFQGAAPDYLIELSQRQDVSCIHLKNNYRSSQTIVDASEYVLKSSRGYIASGKLQDYHAKLEFIECSKGMDEQYERVIEQISRFHTEGIPYHEIAVLVGNNKQVTTLLTPMAKNTQITLTARTNHTVSSISMSVKNPNGATTNLGTVTNTSSISKAYTPTVATHPNDLYTVTVTAVSADGVTTSSTWTFRTY